jgi:hypothetical protein
MARSAFIQPLSPAIQRTRRILFEPFQLSKWLGLGFCSFLMGSTPIGSNPLGGLHGGANNDHSTSGSGVGTSLVDSGLSRFQQHQALVLLVAAIVVALLLLLGLVLTWLSSRGQFMLLDGVVRNRGAIVVPWREYRRKANSLFRFRVALGLGGLLVAIAILALWWLLNVGDWRGDLSGTQMVLHALSSVVVLLGLFAWILALMLISTLLSDFVVPAMYRHRLPIWPAWKLVIRKLLREHTGAVALYLVARLLLNGAMAMLAALATLLSCCLALVPYLGSVILLPLTVFQRLYPLAFLEQLGPDWQLLPPELPAPAHPAASRFTGKDSGLPLRQKALMAEAERSAFRSV